MHSVFTEVKLSDCLTIRYGKNQKDVESDDGEFPILGTGGEIGRTNIALYSKPSVLIGRKGTIDKPRYMDTPFWTVDTLFYTEIHDNALPKFIYYIFTTINWYRYNEASGVPSLSASTVASIKINLPALDEQERAVAVLETWDAYIAMVEKKIQLKMSVKKGMMQQLLSGKKRLPGFEKPWDKTTIKSFARVDSGFGFPESIQGNKNLDIPFIKVSDMNLTGNEEVIKSWNNTISNEQLQSLRAKTFPAGSIIFPKIGAAINTNKKRLLSRPTVVDNNVMVVVPFVLDQNYFIYQWLKMFDISRWANDSGVPSMRKSEVENHIVFAPTDTQEMIEIGNLLKTADLELKSLIKLKNDVAEQRRYLISNLITGAIRTPDNLMIADKETSNA